MSTPSDPTLHDSDTAKVLMQASGHTLRDCFLIILELRKLGYKIERIDRTP